MIFKNGIDEYVEMSVDSEEAKIDFSVSVKPASGLETAMKEIGDAIERRITESLASTSPTAEFTGLRGALGIDDGTSKIDPAKVIADKLRDKADLFDLLTAHKTKVVMTDQEYNKYGNFIESKFDRLGYSMVQEFVAARIGGTTTIKFQPRLKNEGLPDVWIEIKQTTKEGPTGLGGLDLAKELESL